jgi:hypothetical protein
MGNQGARSHRVNYGRRILLTEQKDVINYQD